MKRLKDSDREAITFKPRDMSSRQSSGRGSVFTRFSRLWAIDLIGVSELFSSCPRTRTSRCQACSSSSRNARVKSVRSEEHTSELQSPCNLVCRLLLEKKKHKHQTNVIQIF